MPLPTHRAAEQLDRRSAASDERAARIGAAAVVLVILIQVTVPLVALFVPPPQRFGFQMYSGTGLVTATILHADGGESVLTDFDEFVGKFRGDQDWRQVLPEAICQQVTDAVQVTVEQSGGERSVECP